ncbi:hypothetical protein BDC45DRAFT_498485 [Circinella umbellata]|nr:hypothetical protein BDC45DRAFT_498485 [Circinella umbellata]
MLNMNPNNSAEINHDNNQDLDEDEYEVEKILEHRTTFQKKKQVLEYYIKWKGFKDKWNTWEPEDLVEADELIQEYWASKNKKKIESTTNTLKRSKKTMKERRNKDKGQVLDLAPKPVALNRSVTQYSSSIGSVAKTKRRVNFKSLSSLSTHQTIPSLNNNNTKTNEKSRRKTTRRKRDDDEKLSTINATNDDIENILGGLSKAKRKSLSTSTPTQLLASPVHTVANQNEDDNDISMDISQPPSPSPSQQQQQQHEMVDWSDEHNEPDEVIFDLDFRTDLSWDWKESIHTVEAVTREGPVIYGVVRWNDDTLSMYPTDLIRRRCPQKLIDFYEKKLDFRQQSG